MKTKLIAIIVTALIAIAVSVPFRPSRGEAANVATVPALYCPTSVTASRRVGAVLCHNNYPSPYLIWYRAVIQWCQTTWYGCALKVSYGPWRVNGAVSVVSIPPNIPGYIFYITADY